MTPAGRGLVDLLNEKIAAYRAAHPTMRRADVIKVLTAVLAAMPTDPPAGRDGEDGR